MDRKHIKWNFLVVISTFSILFSFVCFYISFFLIVLERKKVSEFSMPNKSLTFSDVVFAHRVPVGIGFAILGVILFMITPYLDQKRREARDEAEYNEDGIPKKKASFSQLSKTERAEIERQLMIDRQRILPDTLLKTLTHTGPEDSEKALKEMIALDNVKLEVAKMRARMEFELGEKPNKNKKKRKLVEHDSVNMFFTGAPGTGKTTVARILTTIFYDYGYIAKNQCIEVDGNFFNGLSTGESSKRANALIKAAKGGVLFIDEAYSLLSTGGQEVIATMVKAMEDYRDSTIFIFAGYEDEMNTLSNSNPGIESRIKYTFKFNDYNSNELRDIFSLMTNKKNMVADYSAIEKAVDILEKQKRSNKNFGNARAVRTLLDKAIDNHAYNLSVGAISTDNKYRLLIQDIQE